MRKNGTKGGMRTPLAQISTDLLAHEYPELARELATYRADVF